MTIELEIGELILHGVAARDRASIGDAVQRELTRLLGEQGVPRPLQRAGDATALQAAPVQLPHDARPPMVGQRVAAAVYGSLDTM